MFVICENMSKRVRKNSLIVRYVRYNNIIIDKVRPWVTKGTMSNALPILLTTNYL